MIAGISAGNQPALLTIAGLSAAESPDRLFIAGISAAEPPTRLTIAGIAMQTPVDTTAVSLVRKGSGASTLNRKTIGAVTLHRKSSPVPLGVSGNWMLDFEDNFESFNSSIWTPLRGYSSGPYNTPFNPTIEDAAYAADHVLVSNGELLLKATAIPTLGTNGTTYHILPG